MVAGLARQIDRKYILYAKKTWIGLWSLEENIESKPF